MEKYAIYLRKSRIDVEAEKAGEGETLARHRKALLSIAEKRGYYIEKIYEEVVSGETIVSRPQMQALMSDVERGLYTGVLVMEIERLARGDTIDQGLVAQTFKYSDTLIITPLKTYNPNDEFDEEFFEFGLFMSRREYKTINRRLKRGREASAREGKWLFPVAPYGYKRKPLTDQKGTTLEIVEDQAAIVRLIFDLYINGIDGKRLGIQAIARRLNELGIPSARHDYWDKGVIRDILSNPVYAGKIRYGYRKEFKVMIDGKKKSTRPVQYRDNYILAEGLHDAIIPPDIFDKAQTLADLRPIMPVGYKKEIKNPMAGLIFCKLCGRRMTLRKATTPGKPDYLVCHAKSCTNVSAPIHLVEDRLIKSLRSWLRSYEIEYTGIRPATLPGSEIEATAAAIAAKQKEIETLESQLSKAYDLLEQTVYTVKVFSERSETINAKIEAAKAVISSLEQQQARQKSMKDMQSVTIPRIKSILDAYETAERPAEKNAILSQVLEKAVYYKATSGAFRGHSPDNFELEVFPRLPESE